MGLGNICRNCAFRTVKLANKRNAVVVICFLALQSITLAQPSNNTPLYSKNPKLESVLSQLISSDNPQAFAMAKNLYMRNGSIRVVVELYDKTALLPDYIVEETRFDNNVQIMVPIIKIEELSKETNVVFIRTPSTPFVDTVTATPGVQKATPKSGYSLAISFIVSIVLIFLIRKKRRGSIEK
jgi:hypothetical protein